MKHTLTHTKALEVHFIGPKDEIPDKAFGHTPTLRLILAPSQGKTPEGYPKDYKTVEIVLLNFDPAIEPVDISTVMRNHVMAIIVEYGIFPIMYLPMTLGVIDCVYSTLPEDEVTAAFDAAMKAAAGTLNILPRVFFTYDSETEEGTVKKKKAKLSSHTRHMNFFETLGI